MTIFQIISPSDVIITVLKEVYTDPVILTPTADGANACHARFQQEIHLDVLIFFLLFSICSGAPGIFGCKVSNRACTLYYLGSIASFHSNRTMNTLLYVILEIFMFRIAPGSEEFRLKFVWKRRCLIRAALKLRFSWHETPLKSIATALDLCNTFLLHWQFAGTHILLGRERRCDS